MSNENLYVILEFENENFLNGKDETTPVQVGYSEWLIFEKFSKKSLKDLIRSKKLVRSKWPSNYDVQPRKVMLKNKDVIWKEVVAYVRGYANKWEDAIQGSKNFIDTGVCFPTREERKQFAKLKKEEADDQYFSTYQSTKSQVKKKGNIKKSVTKSAQTSILAEIRQQNIVDNNDDSTSISSNGSSHFTSKENKESERTNASITKLSNKRPAAVFSTKESSESDEKDFKIKNKNKKKKSKVSKKKYMKYNISSAESNGSSNESEENSFSWNKDLCYENKLLKKKIKSLQVELGTYKAMKTMIAEFTQLPYHVKKVQERLKECLQDNPRVPISKKISTSVLINNEYKKHASNQDNYSLTDMSIASTSILPVRSTIDSDISISSASEENREYLKDISSINKCDTVSPAAGNTFSSTVEVVRFGSRNVPKSVINKVRHGKIGLLANGLTEAIFTPEEMALGTVRGGKTNAHKGVFQKKCLDQSLVQAIIEYCAKHFGKTVAEVSSEVIKSIGFKLNNFTKTEEGKRIINKHKLRLGLPISDQSTNNKCPTPDKELTQEDENDD